MGVYSRWAYFREGTVTLYQLLPLSVFCSIRKFPLHYSYSKVSIVVMLVSDTPPYIPKINFPVDSVFTLSGTGSGAREGSPDTFLY